MTPYGDDGRCPRCGAPRGRYAPLLHHLTPGTVLAGRYQVGRSLGEGGFGITYIGRDNLEDRLVAIKEYFPKGAATREGALTSEVAVYAGVPEEEFHEGQRRFLREASTLAALADNEVIVDALNFFEENNTAYIVMEYVEGRTLLELTHERGGRIPIGELLPLVRPAFDALSDLHETGLIHRDVAPDNIVLQGERLRLIDFGCAREGSLGTRRITVMLKDGYAPIEQYTKSGQGPWTDVYGLAATLYHCLTGVRPPSALDRQAKDEIMRPRILGVHMRVYEEWALMKGLRLRPTRRFRTMDWFRDALYGTG